MGPRSDVRAADDPEGEEIEDTETEDEEAPVIRGAAGVKIEIKLESGRVVKMDGDVHIDYGVDSSVDVQADGSLHQFVINIKPKGDSKKEVELTVGYDRDGEPIVAPYTFDAKVKKREVLRIEGGIAIAFVITPKKVDDEAAPPGEEQPTEPTEKVKPKDKVEVCEDMNDPLCGMQ